MNFTYAVDVPRNTNLTRSLLVDSLIHGYPITLFRSVNGRPEVVNGRLTAIELESGATVGSPAQHFNVTMTDATGQSVTVYVKTID